MACTRLDLPSPKKYMRPPVMQFSTLWLSWRSGLTRAAISAAQRSRKPTCGSLSHSSALIPCTTATSRSTSAGLRGTQTCPTIFETFIRLAVLPRLYSWSITKRTTTGVTSRSTLNAGSLKAGCPTTLCLTIALASIEQRWLQLARLTQGWQGWHPSRKANLCAQTRVIATKFRPVVPRITQLRLAGTIFILRTIAHGATVWFLGGPCLASKMSSQWTFCDTGVTPTSAGFLMLVWKDVIQIRPQVA
mmetsp:Transcript_19748/g.51426  ORF Transcript_19748/g.51426 Transcript_19748/m.51426 type:complete len:247 (-) Transcript_19748:662-1402(-)